MTNEQKLKRWLVKLEAAEDKVKREAQWIGVRFGAIKATKDAERKVRQIEREIYKLKNIK
jgi:hypothetical protein